MENFKDFVIDRGGGGTVFISWPNAQETLSAALYSITVGTE